MSAISTILARLRAAIWAIDVRDDIANAIEQCYSDVSNPTLKTEALEAALQNKIDEGEMAALTIGDGTITAAKLASGVIDNTLATSGAAADAAETGRQIGLIKADLDAVEDTIDNVGMSATAKAALLECLRRVVYDAGDIDYVGALEKAIYPYAGIIYVTKGLGVSENAIISNTKRAITTEIPFSNTAPITIHVILDNNAASEYMWNFRILDTAGSPLAFAEINGTFKFMRDGVWTIGDGGGWYNHSHEMIYVEDTTIATVRCVVSGKSAKNSMILLIAGADQNADIPTTPLSGDIIIQGRRYRLEEAES